MQVLNITQLPILQTDSSKKKFISTDWYHPNMTSNQIDSALQVFQDQKIYEGMLV